MDSLALRIKCTALDMGYEKCGIIKIADMAGYEDKLNERMGYFYITPGDVWKWKVNVINAMVNEYKEKYKEAIYAARKDSQAKVREIAEWAIKKLSLS